MTPEYARTHELEWASIKTGVAFSSEARGISVIDQDRRTRGVVVFDSWTPNAAQVHMAIDTPMATKTLIEAAADYVFHTACRKLVWMMIRETKTQAVKLARHIGFREMYRVTDGWADGRDIILFELRRDDCRWLSEKVVRHG